MGETRRKYGGGEVNTVFWWGNVTEKHHLKRDRKTSLEKRRRRLKNNIRREAITYGVTLRRVRGTNVAMEKQ